MQVLRSAKSLTRLSTSDPTTTAVFAAPVRTYCSATDRA
jgi:hypothetical protein